MLFILNLNSRAAVLIGSPTDELIEAAVRNDSDKTPKCVCHVIPNMCMHATLLPGPPSVAPAAPFPPSDPPPLAWCPQRCPRPLSALLDLLLFLPISWDFLGSLQWTKEGSGARQEGIEALCRLRTAGLATNGGCRRGDQKYFWGVIRG